MIVEVISFTVLNPVNDTVSSEFEVASTVVSVGSVAVKVCVVAMGPCVCKLLASAGPILPRFTEECCASGLSGWICIPDERCDEEVTANAAVCCA